ncbi:putative TetR family transcriptional regulator [Gordonia araii NBRC 100433]|uniref:Putative TetR family transcriptional regulator n=1 Tax=Gordonia araii NBRC 100433 TaxID=1073574 RepID=G7GXS8_9ACTN|nr:TetR/AcrR family transcriptional regulator [Gordonia araii]NNG98401.1 TetR/AcrR family transcriptional regulator [Gordonia araii NBRC 100433]GAB08403.1 putative TetR family transcriptional regulator [Gordonia araii NBRC 100433]
MEKPTSDTRTRLLDAAAELIAAAPGEEFSLRDVCDRAGVKMPTLYHFFGNKQGLTEAVVERGFEQYAATKAQRESSGDPIQDIRDGWDAHVEFGLANPGVYALMYGTVRPGDPAPAQAKPTAMLRELVRRAAEQNRLVVPEEQAVGHILAANIGVTLRQIILAQADPELSAAMRDGVIAAITGTPDVGTSVPREALLVTLDHAVRNPAILGSAETALLADWLQRLVDSQT